MKLKAAGLATALLAVSAAAHASECREDVEARLAVLEEAFDDQRRGLDIWSGSWAGIYSAIAIGQGIAAFAVSGEGSARGELAFGAVAAAVGALSAGLLPLRFTVPLRNIRSQWGDADRCALLARAEAVREKVAREQAISKGWFAHGANVLVNVAIGVSMGLAFKNWQAGLISGVVGIAIGTVNLISQPNKLGRVAESPRVQVVPVFSRDFTGAGLVLAF